MPTFRRTPSPSQRAPWTTCWRAGARRTCVRPRRSGAGGFWRRRRTWTRCARSRRPPSATTSEPRDADARYRHFFFGILSHSARARVDGEFFRRPIDAKASRLLQSFFTHPSSLRRVVSETPLVRTFSSLLRRVPAHVWHAGAGAGGAREHRGELHEHVHDFRVVLVLHDVVGVRRAVHHRLLDLGVLERHRELGVAHQFLDRVLRGHAHRRELLLHLRRVHIRHAAREIAAAARFHLRHDALELVLVHRVREQHLERLGVAHHLRQVRVHHLLHLRVAQHLLHVLKLRLLVLCAEHGLALHRLGEGVGGRRLRRRTRVFRRVGEERTGTGRASLLLLLLLLARRARARGGRGGLRLRLGLGLGFGFGVAVRV
mmetsp:Transcript_12533/g.52544  ORF Transcript_12533/g.52544 Transcript_12533/m.52544 type:complete len:373 (+) Transcript_12533:586-1704(+)